MQEQSSRHPRLDSVIVLVHEYNYALSQVSISLGYFIHRVVDSLTSAAMICGQMRDCSDCL